MFCPNCGTNLPYGTEVCTTCGFRQKGNQQPAPQPAPEPIPQPAPQPVPQPVPQPAPQPIPQPVYQRPAPITKKEYLKNHAPASVKTSSLLVVITLLLTLALVVTSAVLPLTTNIFEIPVVSVVLDFVFDEVDDPEIKDADDLLDEFEESYDGLKAAYKVEKYAMSRSEKKAAEEGLDAFEAAIDNFSVLNVKNLLDVLGEQSDEYRWMMPGNSGEDVVEYWDEEAQVYKYVDMGTEEEIEQAGLAMTLVIAALVGSFFLPLLLTLIAGLKKSTGCTIAAVIFTVLNQVVLCGFVWVVLSLVIFILQAVFCSKINKAYQNYRLGKAMA